MKRVAGIVISLSLVSTVWADQYYQLIADNDNHWCANDYYEPQHPRQLSVDYWNKRHTVHLVKKSVYRRSNAVDNTVLFVQKALQQLAYKPGPADGLMGSRTRRAIWQYQSDHYLPSDGRVSPRLLSHIKAFIQRQNKAQTPRTRQAVKLPTASQQALEAESIRLIQRALTRLGYKPGPVDGLFGTRTRLAIHDYQRDYHLPIDGNPSIALMDHLSIRIKDEHEANRATLTSMGTTPGIANIAVSGY